MSQQLTARERFIRTMKFQDVDRLPMVEWAPWWHLTTNRWQEEGLVMPTENAGIELQRQLGLDLFCCLGVGSRRPECPAYTGHSKPLMPSASDWPDFRKYLYPEVGFSEDYARYLAGMQAEGAIIWMVLEGFFWFPRTLFGIEEHLFALLDEPEIMHEMNQGLAEHHNRQIEQIFKIITPDIMTFAEDMSYNHGPMLSRKMYDEFMHPYYLQIVPQLKEAGVLVFADSDGDVTEPIKWFKESGIEGILPLERMAGVDVNQIRQDHPEFLMLGGYDKTVMHLGEARVRQEFERLMPAMKSGGYVVGVDHQTPPGCSFADYQQYLRIYREYAELAAR